MGGKSELHTHFLACLSVWLEDQAQALKQTAVAFVSWANCLNYQSLGIYKMGVLLPAL